MHRDADKINVYVQKLTQALYFRIESYSKSVKLFYP